MRWVCGGLAIKLAPPILPKMQTCAFWNIDSLRLTGVVLVYTFLWSAQVKSLGDELEEAPLAALLTAAFIT